MTSNSESMSMSRRSRVGKSSSFSTKVGQARMDGTIHSDYKALNANQTNWRRIISYYEAHAEDRSKISYTFRNTGLHIVIFVHEKVPLEDFRKVLYQFFQVMKNEDRMKSDQIDIRVVKRDSGPVVEDGIDVAEEAE